MGRGFAQLQEISGKDRINDTFLCQLKKGLLLALRERGIIDYTQYRQAEETLTRQHHHD